MEISDIKIDPEFRDKIPRQTVEEYSGLKADILADGYVRDPLTVWKEENILLDGHHRWQIITENWDVLKDKFSVDYRSMPNRWAAIAWICANQLHRHNMNEFQRGKLIQEEHDAILKSEGGDGTNQYTKKEEHGQSDQVADPTGTRAVIAKEHGISESKVKREVEFGRGLDKADEAVPGFKQEVLSGETKVTKKEVAALRNLPKEEIPAAVEEIKKPKVRFPSIRDNSAIKPLDKELQAIAESNARARDKSRTAEYGLSDLLSELRALHTDFLNKYHTVMDIRRDVATDNVDAVMEVIKEFEKEFNKIKEVLA